MKSVQQHYDFYLKTVGLSESKMHPVQKVETKRTFFAAFGQCLLFLRDELSDNEETAIQEIDSWKNEVNNFFQAESKRNN